MYDAPWHLQIVIFRDIFQSMIDLSLSKKAMNNEMLGYNDKKEYLMRDLQIFDNGCDSIIEHEIFEFQGKAWLILTDNHST